MPSWTEVKLDINKGSGANWNLSSSAHGVKTLGCLHMPSRTLVGTAWHAKYSIKRTPATHEVYGSYRHRPGRRTGDEPGISCLRQQLRKECARHDLGAISTTEVEIFDAFSEASTGCRYQIDDVLAFLPIWQRWADYFTERAYSAEQDLLLNLPAIRDAAKLLLLRKDVKKLANCLQELDASATQFAEEMGTMLERAGWYGGERSQNRRTVRANLRHLLINVLLEDWPGDSC